MKMQKILSIVEVLLLMPFLCFPSFAAEHHGTIHLHSSIKMAGQEVYLSGDEFSLVKIADAEVTEKNGSPYIYYENLPNYKDFDSNWGDLNSEEMRSVVKQLEKIATKNEDYLITAVVDAHGNASFTNLSSALYLVICTKVNPQNGTHYIDPFLISIPTLWDNSILYTTNCFPKSGLITPKPDVKPDNGPNLSQTGQLKWPIPLLSLSGIVLIIIGWILISSENKNKE